MSRYSSSKLVKNEDCWPIFQIWRADFGTSFVYRNGLWWTPKLVQFYFHMRTTPLSNFTLKFTWEGSLLNYQNSRKSQDQSVFCFLLIFQTFCSMKTIQIWFIYETKVWETSNIHLVSDWHQNFQNNKSQTR